MLLFVVHPESTGFKVDNTFSLQVVAVIPARFASSRFPGKPLADLDGRPMIEHVYRRATASPSVAQVIVATDDLRIAAAVQRFGGDVRMTRPEHLSGTDRLAEVAATLDCDIIVNVQGDEPLIDPESISEAVAPFFADASLQANSSTATHIRPMPVSRSFCACSCGVNTSPARPRCRTSRPSRSSSLRSRASRSARRPRPARRRGRAGCATSCSRCAPARSVRGSAC